MTDSRYKTYEDCTLEELENIVEDLENMSIAALKSKKVQVNAIALGEPVTEKPDNVRRVILDQKQYKSFGANLIVSGNKVFAVSFTGNMYAVYIENSNIAETVKMLFNLVENSKL